MANPPVVQRGPTQTFQDEVVINDELTLHSNTLTRQLLSDIFPTFDSLLCDPDMWRVVHACFMFRQFQCRRLAPPLLTPALPVGAKLIPVVGHGIEKLEFKLFSFIFYECDPIYTWYMKMYVREKRSQKKAVGTMFHHRQQRQETEQDCDGTSLCRGRPRWAWRKEMLTDS